MAECMQLPEAWCMRWALTGQVWQILENGTARPSQPNTVAAFGCRLVVDRCLRQARVNPAFCLLPSAPIKALAASLRSTRFIDKTQAKAPWLLLA